MTELKWVSRQDALPKMAFASDPITIKRHFEENYPRLPIDKRYILSKIKT